MSQSSHSDHSDHSKHIFCIPTPDIMFTERCNMRCKYCFEQQKNLRDINEDQLIDYIQAQTNCAYFPFGGEPLLVADTIIKLKKLVDSLDTYEIRKKEMSKSMGRIITNGTLITKYWKQLKEQNISIQFSVDGPQNVHDRNRIFPNGKGSFEKVMEAIKICEREYMDWSLHGVITRDTLSSIFEIFKFFFNMYKIKKPWKKSKSCSNHNSKNRCTGKIHTNQEPRGGIKEAINRLHGNPFQIIFEENYTDADINLVITQFIKCGEWIWQHPELSLKEKKEVIHAFYTRTGGTCAAGTSLLAIDVDFNIYPCHRLTSVQNRAQFKLGNVFDLHNFQNFQLYNNYFDQNLRNHMMYSAAQNLTGFRNRRSEKWFMWCPSTNYQTSHNIYYQSAKYNVLTHELDRALEVQLKRYHIH